MHPRSTIDTHTYSSPLPPSVLMRLPELPNALARILPLLIPIRVKPDVAAGHLVPQAGLMHIV